MRKRRNEVFDMIIFPLSWLGKIALMLIAIFLGLILWMLWKPERWKKFWRKGEKPKWQKQDDEIKKKKQ